MKKLAILLLLLLAMPMAVTAEETTLTDDILSEIAAQVESLLANESGATPTPAAPTSYTPAASAAQTAPAPGLVSLTQQFDTALGMYEILFPNGPSFLANVPNGGRTRDEVTLNLPANMRTDAALDGMPFHYVSGQMLNMTGDYIFRITAPNIYGGGESTAVFRFRILPPAGLVTNEEFFAFSSNDGSDTLEYVFSNHRRFFANVADGETLPGPVTINVPEPLFGSLTRDGEFLRLENNRPIREPGDYVLRVTAPPFARTAARATTLATTLNFTISEPAPPSVIQLPGAAEGLQAVTDIAGMLPQFGQSIAPPVAEQALPEQATPEQVQPEQEQEPPEPVLLPDLLSVMPMEGTEYFNVFFSNGSGFLSSIEMGVVAEEPVFFEIPAWMEYELLAGGVPVPFVSGTTIDAPGVYVLRVTAAADGQPWSYVGEFAFAVGEGADGVPELEAIPAITAPVGLNLPEQTFAAPHFLHYITSELLFSTTAANGETLTEPVTFSVIHALSPVLTLNGEELPFEGDETITAPGEYLLTVSNPITGEAFHFFFVILPVAVPAPIEIMPPIGYAITSVMHNDTPHLHIGGGAASLSAEGDYTIIMHAPDAPDLPERVLHLALNFTPPIITVEEADREITFSVDDGTAAVTLYMNGENIPLQWTVSAPGEYRVVAADPAGNIVEAEFSIPYRMNVTAILFIVLVVLLLGGGAFYFFRIHKHAKV